MTGPMPDTPPVLPEAFVVADRISLLGQRNTVRAIAARLLFTVAAALTLALAPLWPTHLFHRADVQVLALAAAAFFLAALLVEFGLIRDHPERRWYEGRAVAESAKTLTWRYAVGALPYPIDRNAETALKRDVHNLTTDVAPLADALASAKASTAWMEHLRSSDLTTRRKVYLEHRIEDQQAWYARKAAYNAQRAKWWSIGLLAAEALGVVLAALKALSYVSIDLASLASALIASGGAWLAVKQYESLAAAYLLASRELNAIKQHLLTVKDEHRWATEAADAEEAISREHTMWRASRTVPDPATGYGRRVWPQPDDG
jgi:hypothetical protein